jgi:hypothetical protein
MKRLVVTLLAVAALCVVLTVPAAAGQKVAVSGESITTDGVVIELRPVGQGDDDHYCQITVELWSELSGDMFEHYEILKRGPCRTGGATDPAVQRAWGTFTGQMWDGEQMREGTCRTFWRGGYYWADDGVTLLGGGKQTLHTCTGGLKGAHADLDFVFNPDGLDTYAGTAFFSK